MSLPRNKRHASDPAPSGSDDTAMEADVPLPDPFFEKRNEQLNILFEIAISLYNAFSFNYKADVMDLDESGKVSGTLATVYTYARKLKNPQSQASAAKIGELETNVVTHTKVKDLYAANKDKFERIDFKIATPLMNIITSFKIYLEEVRLGVTKFTTRRQGDMTKNPVYNITSVGLGNVHIPLLLGITLQPERRTALLRGLGPMTLAILLLNEKEYKEKLIEALKNSLSMLPMGDSVAIALSKTSITEAKTLLKELGDLLLITSHRSTRRIYFPLIFLLKSRETMRLDDLNFSGTKGITYYNLFAIKSTFKMKTKANSDLIRQAVFHAMFGTYLEDLSILSQITDFKNWVTRREMDVFFTQRAQESAKNFKMIPFTYISKLLNANPTKLLGTVQPMLIGGLSFAGNRKRSFSVAFKEYLNSGRQIVSYSTDVGSLTYAVRSLRTEILNKTEDEKLKNAGTSKWYKYTADGLEESELVVVENGIFFYS